MLMPNHIHLLIMINHENGGGILRTVSPTTTSPTKAAIPRIIHALKPVITKQM